MRAKRWYDYFWLWAILYFALGFFNIAFAWLGLFDFTVPLLFAVFGGNKWFCNHMCGRSQLFVLLAKKCGCCRQRPAPRWLSAPWFRYAFLAFFMTMFGSMLWQTYLVYGGSAALSETVTLLWSFKLPWHWAYTAGSVPDWAAQFSFGFYSVMLTSALLGLTVMALYRPRTWCGFCPMGTMTQLICKARQSGGTPSDASARVSS